MSVSRRSLVALSLMIALTPACSKEKGEGEVTITSGSGTVEAARKTAPPSPGGVMSCMTAEGLCSEWSGLSPRELKEAKESCEEPGEKFSATPCPRKDAFATCRHLKEKVTIFLPKAAGFTMKDAKEMCEDGELSQIK
jgi:hypothetical protein